MPVLYAHLRNIYFLKIKSKFIDFNYLIELTKFKWKKGKQNSKEIASGRQFNKTISKKQIISIDRILWLVP